jgi:hypothetical protein
MELRSSAFEKLKSQNFEKIIENAEADRAANK